MERYAELRRPSGVLRGMLHLPERRLFRPPWPAVALFHGFTSSRMEARFLFVSFSRLLARNGIASARFDFLGSGESDGEFPEVTLSGEIADAGAVLDWLGRVRGVDRRRLLVLGLSAGATVAGCLAGDRGEEVRGLVLWSSAGEISERIRERAEALREAAASSAPGRDPMDYGGLRIGEGYLADAAQVQVLRRSAAYPGPVLVGFGTSDSVVSPEVSRGYGELYGERARLVPIQGAGHTFESVPWREELFRHSLEFIRQHARRSGRAIAGARGER
jgi:pimeloyl-ACP methyl ester carboxylesterase